MLFEYLSYVWENKIPNKQKKSYNLLLKKYSLEIFFSIMFFFWDFLRPLVK